MKDAPKTPPSANNFSKNSILVAKQLHQKRRKEEPLYYPSIFQYTCRGALGVSSQEVGSPGTCFGIQSRLEHVRDMPTCSRQEATDAFERVVMDQAGYSNANGRSQPGTNNDTAHVEKLTLLLQNQALIYKEEKDNMPEKQRRTSPEGEEEWHEWSCYGSTQVQLLVLRETNSSQKETIAGVAPDCRLGVSIRDVGTKEHGGGVIGTIRAGPLEVNLVGDYYNGDDEDEEQVMQNKRNTVSEGDNKDRNVMNIESSESIDRKDKSTVRKQQTSRKGQEMFTERFSKASVKVLGCMQQNLNFVRNELSDHFLERTYESGTRVVGNFGKTWDRTTQLMHSVYKMWRNDK